MLVRLGFAQGRGSANVFWHALRKTSCSVYGDDFNVTGPADALDWYEAAVASEYEIAAEPRLGPGPGDAKEARVLNRVIPWQPDRVEYEADPRQDRRVRAYRNNQLDFHSRSQELIPRDFETDEPLDDKLYGIPRLGS